MSPFWSWFIILLVVLHLLGYAWLLWWTGRRRPGDPKPEDTSHYWDGDLTEYNKPMPRWWLLGFYLSLVFGVAYLAWYPGMGAWTGAGGWSSAREHDADRAEADARLAIAFARFEDQPLEALARDPQALQHGGAIFANHCATCHGSDARGAKGFPNLTDAVWHWGGSADAVLETVRNGRQAAMPALGATLGGEIGITETAVYVQSLAGQKVDAAFAAAGKARFAGICAACHGAEGKGNPALGAPDLTDDYWLYGADLTSIRETIVKGRNGMMPAHAPILGETRSRLVAAWVLAQSGAAGGAGSGK
jgi:cytochrome c oxidase cbb3-type subunit 3